MKTPTPLQESLVRDLVAAPDNDGSRAQLIVSQSYITSDSATDIVQQFDGIAQKQIIIGSIVKEKDLTQRKFIVLAVLNFCIEELAILLTLTVRLEYFRRINKRVAEIITGRKLIDVPIHRTYKRKSLNA